MCRVSLIMKDMKKRILAGLIACITAYSFSGNQAVFLSSAEEKPTVQELENQKAENDKKIAELKKEIDKAKKDYDSVVSDENAKLDYQNALNEKIILQNQ